MDVQAFVNDLWCPKLLQTFVVLFNEVLYEVEVPAELRSCTDCPFLQQFCSECMKHMMRRIALFFKEAISAIMSRTFTDKPYIANKI